MAFAKPGSALNQVDSLNIQETSQSGIQFLDYEELDSTNSEAKRLVGSGKQGNFVVSAKKQTKGRGRFNRFWYSSDENVAMTISMAKTKIYRDFGTLSLMTGLAVFDVLQDLINSGADIKIKWPNDIMVNNAKISGTLVETDASCFYVGVGVNINVEPEEVIYPTVSLNQFHDIHRLDLIEKIALKWHRRFDNWCQFGFAKMAEDYSRNLWRMGEVVTIFLDAAKEDKVEGRCLGVNEKGLLLLDSGGGSVRAFATGDVGA